MDLKVRSFVVAACATGAYSIGDSGEMIKRGAADVMIAGGSEAAVCRLGIAGFCAAEVLAHHTMMNLILPPGLGI